MRTKGQSNKKGKFLRKATPVNPDDCWSIFEDKDSYTTAEISKAVGLRIANEMGMSTHLSCPVPLKFNQEIYLSFFLYRTSIIEGKSFSNPPFCKVFSSLKTYKKIEFKVSQPCEFNINVPVDTALVDLKLFPRFRPYKGYELVKNDFLNWKNPLYNLIDKILFLYSQGSNRLVGVEKAELQEYVEMFGCLIEPLFLPAYRSLNSHFFDWLELNSEYSVDEVLTYPKKGTSVK